LLTLQDHPQEFHSPSVDTKLGNWKYLNKIIQLILGPLGGSLPGDCRMLAEDLKAPSRASAVSIPCISKVKNETNSQA